MDATTLRLILIAVGVLLIVALYLWERRRGREDDDDDGLDEPAAWPERRDPSLDVWDTPTSPAGSGGDELYRPPQHASERERGVSLLERLRGFGSSSPAGDAAAESDSESAASDPDPDAPLIVQLSVVATDDGRFDGVALVRAASTCGLEAGEMDVFHCYLGDENEQRTLFRVANLVKPGTFPFGSMEGFTSPGLVLFASIEGESGDLAIVDEMVATARCLAEELNGEIRDETRNPFTAAKEDTLRARVLARQMAHDAEASDEAEES